MTASAKTGSNGTKPESAPERTCGLDRIQDARSYHLASLAHTAAFEAEHLCSQIYRTASERHLRDTGAAEEPNVADDLAMGDIASEAVSCLAAAVAYLTDLFASQLGG